MKLCYETRIGGYPIKLYQHGRDSFKVRYGMQIDDRLDYGNAAAKIGQAIMHALSCEGKVDNRERGEI